MPFSAQHVSVRGEVHQGIQGKSRHAATQQIVDARLAYSAMNCSISLFPVVGLDNGCDLLHQFCKRPKVGGLFWRIGNCPKRC